MPTVLDSTTPEGTREYAAMLSRQKMLERASNLFKDGYSVFAVCKTTNTGRRIPIRGAFTIISPRGDAYAVDVIDQTCECVCWRRNGACKHVRGLYRLCCQQSQETMHALFPVRFASRQNAARYMEAADLFRAIEDCRVYVQSERRAAA